MLYSYIHTVIVGVKGLMILIADQYWSITSSGEKTPGFAQPKINTDQPDEIYHTL